MVKFSFKFLLGEYWLHSCTQGKREMYCIDSPLDSQIFFYNEDEFCHLLQEWLYNIDIKILLMIILL